MDVVRISQALSWYRNYVTSCADWIPIGRQQRWSPSVVKSGLGLPACVAARGGSGRRHPKFRVAPARSFRPETPMRLYILHETVPLIRERHTGEQRHTHAIRHCSCCTPALCMGLCVPTGLPARQEVVQDPTPSAIMSHHGL